MLSLLPTPFWDTNTQMTVAGIEPAGLAVKRTLGKNFKGDPNNLLTCPYCLRGRSLRNKMKNIKETSMNEIEGGTRTLNAFTTP